MANFFPKNNVCPWTFIWHFRVLIFHSKVSYLRCIVWCKQLTLALNRILFDLIEKESKQLSDDKEDILKVFNYHLIQRTGGKRYRPDLHPKQQVFDKQGDWKQISTLQYTFKHQMVRKFLKYLERNLPFLFLQRILSSISRIIRTF